MEKINPTDVLYIKLGHGGDKEERCITGGTLEIGFRAVSHELYLKCLASGKWDKVQKAWQDAGKTAGVATRYTNQIRKFYEADESTLWVTFWKDTLWWCFANSESVQLNADNTKTRHTISGWKSLDIRGQSLAKTQLSGGLLAMQGFMGTICTVKESEYLVNKINGNEPTDAAIAMKALADLEAKLAIVIQGLKPKDFEILIDLIFRQMGCQRVSVLGETMKDLDLVLRSPMDDELYGVQVKSQATLKTFRRFKDEQVTGMDGLARFYFATHSPDLDLTTEAETEDVKLLLSADIARLSVRHGLTQWVIDKAR